MPCVGDEEEQEETLIDIQNGRSCCRGKGRKGSGVDDQIFGSRYRMLSNIRVALHHMDKEMMSKIVSDLHGAAYYGFHWPCYTVFRK